MAGKTVLAGILLWFAWREANRADLLESRAHGVAATMIALAGGILLFL